MIDHNFVENEIPTVPLHEVSAYSIRRSVSSPYLFTVVAIDREGEALYVVESDITFEQAQLITETFNNPTV